MGLALLFVIWLITLVSSYFFMAPPAGHGQWWLPADASLHGAAIDSQFTFTFITMGVVFLAAQLALGLFAWKYRDRSRAQAHYYHGNARLEIAWSFLTGVLFIGLNLMGTKIWAENRFQGASAGALPVEVSALQFAWYFRYPGPDGKFGRTKVDLQDASVGNPVGLDETDPAAKDDIVSGVMMLPVGREVDLTLRSQDVIHSFFVPSLRIKQDSVPGLMIHIHFTPRQTGDYELACAELCGLGHYKMHGIVRVVSQPDFDKWQAQAEAEKEQ